MPYNYIVETGVIIPDTSTLKSDIQAEYVAQFGPTMLLEDDTPQGRLIDIETTARSGVIGITAETANMINPQVSAGTFLKAICGLHDVWASGETFTVLTGVSMVGSFNTTVPSDSRIVDSDGNYYRLVADTAIGPAISALGNFQAVDAGPLNPTLASLSIVDGTFGWTGIDATSAVVAVGSLEEDDSQLRAKRTAQLSKMGKGQTAAIASNVSAVDGVRALKNRDNPDSVGATIDGVVMPASSTWICVQGGVDADIGLALLDSKQTGSPYTGGSSNGTIVSQMLVDPISGQSYPVIFTRPIEKRSVVRITVASGSSVDPATAVPTVVLQYANGQLPNEPGYVVGVHISPFEISAAINAQLPSLFIRKVEVAFYDGVTPPSYSTDELVIALWEVATLASGDITVVVS
jgi:hypothetical protein